jgi:uncharacterized protein (DUF1330 family)
VLEFHPFDPPRTGIAVLVRPAHALTRHCHGTVQNIVLAKVSRRNVRRGKRRNFMKQFFGVGLGMLAGAAIGALAVSGLHAQGKPSVYLVTEIDVTDPDNYAKEFAPKAQATIKSAGGRFVVIGGVAGVGAKSITGLAGTPPKRITIQAWDSMDAISAWYKGRTIRRPSKLVRSTPLSADMRLRVNRI